MTFDFVLHKKVDDSFVEKFARETSNDNGETL